MLEMYAQDIVRVLCEALGRSILITDLDATIIGAAAEERIGTKHSPSIPVMKYGKMSFDDTEAARELGVWYPGATVPIFFQGRVVGSVAIAGEPEVVCKFALLVKNQVESILREKVLIESTSSSQRRLDDLMKSIFCFDPARDNPRNVENMASKYGYNLNIPRVAIAVEFSNFRELSPSENTMGLDYQNSPDPFQDELDYQALRGNVVNVLRATFSDPQDLVSSVSRDRFVVLKAMSAEEASDGLLIETAYEQSLQVFRNLQSSSIDTTIGLGTRTCGLQEIPASYDNAWDTVTLAKKRTPCAGVYRFHDCTLEHILLSMKKQPHHSSIWEKAEIVKQNPDGGELLETFVAYCEAFFGKQQAAERLFIHRNTLLYRLNKLEKLLGLDLSNFDQAISFYLACKMDGIEE